MDDPLSIVSARNSGEIRYAVVTEFSRDLSRVLGKLGLTADAGLLVELDREAATAVLRALLWKDMAYSIEIMPELQAEAIARRVIDQYGRPLSRYYSNGDWSTSRSWNPMTASTFDGGLVIDCNDATYFCIWFQDED